MGFRASGDIWGMGDGGDGFCAADGGGGGSPPSGPSIKLGPRGSPHKKIPRFLSWILTLFCPSRRQTFGSPFKNNVRALPSGRSWVDPLGEAPWVVAPGWSFLGGSLWVQPVGWNTRWCPHGSSPLVAPPYVIVRVLRPRLLDASGPRGGCFGPASRVLPPRSVGAPSSPLTCFNATSRTLRSTEWLAPPPLHTGSGVSARRTMTTTITITMTMTDCDQCGKMVGSLENVNMLGNRK